MGAPHGGGPHEDVRGTSTSLQSEPRASIYREQCLDVAPVPCDAFPAFASAIRHLLLVSKKFIASEEREEGRAISHVVLVLFMCTVNDHFHGDGLLWGSTPSASFAMADGGAVMGGQAVVSDIGSVSSVQQHGHDLEYDQAYIRFKINHSRVFSRYTRVAKLPDAMNAVNYFASRHDRQQIVFSFHISFAF
ncbi:hypothetical protein MUK42_33280 [Musa troglodytarum]|uniref:Uncharacterized protein n=1 Tax=Musa troglodytarum TaxID=320322 RepID=A0A9E7L2W6_9LILI|nr:hypothetical protein MUK42_33280 [Musa troglodytarum]